MKLIKAIVVAFSCMTLGGCLTEKLARSDNQQKTVKNKVTDFTSEVKRAYLIDQYDKSNSPRKGYRRLFMVVNTRNNVNNASKRFLVRNHYPLLSRERLRRSSVKHSKYEVRGPNVFRYRRPSKRKIIREIPVFRVDNPKAYRIPAHLKEAILVSYWNNKISQIKYVVNTSVYARYNVKLPAKNNYYSYNIRFSNKQLYPSKTVKRSKGLGIFLSPITVPIDIITGGKL